MVKRLTRAARAEANRGEVLAAARRVFLARGYAGATLDAIAEEAGFSKGVVYSQFGAKADLFLALLDERIAARAAQNRAVVAGARGVGAVTALVRAGRKDAEDEAAWALVLIEFRLHAARDRELNRRYAAAHRRTVDGIADLLERALAEAGVAPGPTPRQLAVLVLALRAGLQLETAAEAKALPERVASAAMRRLLGFREAEGSEP